ncbi:MAG: LysM peptidoglycan-binding domain-containing protein, partial [Dysgonomonas sp.]
NNNIDDSLSANTPPPLPFLHIDEESELSSDPIQTGNEVANTDDGDAPKTDVDYEEEEIVVPHIKAVTPENKYISEERMIVPDDVPTFEYTSSKPEQSVTILSEISPEIEEEKQNSESSTPETVLSDIEKDNDSMNDQEDFSYPDYDAIYEEEDKKRKLFRIIPYILLGIVLLIISILGFSKLIERINKSKRIPYYNSGNLVDSDTMPAAKKANANFSDFPDSGSLDSAAKETARQLQLLKNSIENNTSQVPPKDSVKGTEAKIQTPTASNLQQPNQKIVGNKGAGNSGNGLSPENTKKNNPQTTQESELQVYLNKAHEKFESKKKGSSITPKETKADQPEANNNPSQKNIATVTLKQGESLRTISAKYYGKKEYWVYLYKENRNRISNPNNVPIGTRLVVPDLSKYVENPQDPNSVQAAKNLEKQIIRK